MEAPDSTQILVVCTANICRSPMFGALLGRDLAAIGAPFEVSSGGLLEWDEPADPSAVAVLAGHGLDISDHRSRPLATLDMPSFGLILTMTREHLREIVIDEPELFPVTFTAKAFARALDISHDGELPEGISARIRALSAGRPTSSMLGQSTEDDVADPYRLGQQEFEATAAELADLSRRISLGLHALSH
jgi:protein-tyrosine phosphatase